MRAASCARTNYNIPLNDKAEGGSERNPERKPSSLKVSFPSPLCRHGSGDTRELSRHSKSPRTRWLIYDIICARSRGLLCKGSRRVFCGHECRFFASIPCLYILKILTVLQLFPLTCTRALHKRCPSGVNFYA